MGSHVGALAFSISAASGNLLQSLPILSYLWLHQFPYFFLIWIHHLFFPLFEDFPYVMSNEVVITSYKVHLQASGPALALVLACGSWVAAFSESLCITFLPDLWQRWLQIVPINSINFFTFWCFSLSSWDRVQLAGYECAYASWISASIFINVGGCWYYWLWEGIALLTELLIN